MNSHKEGDGARDTRPESLSAQFEQALAKGEQDIFVLRLYVAGSRPSSLRAVRNLRSLCEQHLAGRYDLEVIDIYSRPEAATEADVIAAPTLIKQLPLPVQRFLGDLAKTEQVRVALAIPPPPER